MLTFFIAIRCLYILRTQIFSEQRPHMGCRYCRCMTCRFIHSFYCQINNSNSNYSICASFQLSNKPFHPSVAPNIWLKSCLGWASTKAYAHTVFLEQSKYGSSITNNKWLCGKGCLGSLQNYRLSLPASWWF